MAIVKLGELCEIIPGKKPNKDLHKYITKNKNDGFNWIKQKDLESFNILLKTSSYFKKEFISMTRYTSGKNIYFFPDCDIKAFESKIDFCYDGHTWELINNEKILKKFLLYSINKNINNLKRQQVGTTLKFITRSIFENFKIYVPTINDQQKIIDIIEPFENKLNELTNKLNIIKNIE
ncbi:MAG: restriction endonuclease subunit S, partial [Ureaplasma sp.]|nr:restriction endonuclease subunit S [Ureaplasma sp.]